MVNSGSSANLLAIASLNLKKGSEIITPTLTFSTTVAPIYQLGMVPHFVDVEMNKFIINTEQIEKAINNRRMKEQTFKQNIFRKFGIKVAQGLGTRALCDS